MVSLSLSLSLSLSVIVYLSLFVGLSLSFSIYLSLSMYLSVCVSISKFTLSVCSVNQFTYFILAVIYSFPSASRSSTFLIDLTYLTFLSLLDNRWNTRGDIRKLREQFHSTNWNVNNDFRGDKIRRGETKHLNSVCVYTCARVFMCADLNLHEAHILNYDNCLH